VSDKLAVRGVVTALSWYNSQIRSFTNAEMEQALAYIDLPRDTWPDVLEKVAFLRREVHRASQRKDAR